MSADGGRSGVSQFNVQLGIAKAHDQVEGNLYSQGIVEITPDAVHITGWPRGGGGLAVSAVRMAKGFEGNVTIDPRTSQGYVDMRRRRFSFPIADGKWVVGTSESGIMSGPSREKMEAMVAALRPLFGDRLTEANLTGMPGHQKVLWCIFAVCMGLAAIGCLAAFLLKRR